MKIAKLQSSGKEGTESAALFVAKKHGIIISGYKPKDSSCHFREIKDTISAKEEQSIVWNVRDSHATLVIASPEKMYSAELAYEIAENFERPTLISGNSNEIIRWLDSLGEELTINVIGPNEKEDPLCKRKTKVLIEKVLSHYDAIYIL